MGFGPELIRCGDHRPKFFKSNLFFIDTPIGEAAKTTVRIEVDLFRTPEFEGLPAPGNNVVNRFGRVGPWIADTEANFPVRKCRSHNFEIAGSWSGVFEDQLTDIHF